MVELCRDELPAAVQLAHQHVLRHAHVVVVGRGRRVAGGRDDRGRKTLGAGVENQDRHALVPWPLRVGTRGQPDVIRRLRARGPEFVAIDHEVIVLPARRGFEHRQVAAGLRLGITDGKDDFPGRDTRQKFGLLRLSAVRH